MSTPRSTPRSTPPDDTRLVSTFPHPGQVYSAQPHWVTSSPQGQARYVSPDPSPTFPPGGRGGANGYPFPHLASYGQYARPVGTPGQQNAQVGSDEDGGRRSSGESKRRPSKRVDGKQPTFLTKLYQILSTPEYNSIIRWDDVGDTVIIEKPEVLAAKILPLVYRQSRFASFSRQLNIYGFMRKVSLRHVEKDITDPDASTWSHPFLKRSSTSAEVQAFKRRVPPRPAQTNKRRVSGGYDNNPMPSLSPSPSVQGNTYQSPPDMYHSRQLGSLGENEAASYPFNPSYGSSYPPPMQHASFAPPNRLVYYLTSSSCGSDFGGSLPNRPYFRSLPSDRMMPPSLQMSVPIQPGSATSSVFTPSLPAGHSLTAATQSLAFPQTAPPHASSFPELAKITQGHIRTRSVQGEPPSATLLSPADPKAWGEYHPDPNDPILRIGGDVPTYDPNDARTWARRGWNNIHTGQPASPPCKEIPGLTHDFAPTLLSPDPPSAGFDSTQGGAQQGCTYKPYVPSTPRAMPIRTERDRKASISSSPYSPRSRPSPELSFSGLISFGRGGSGSRGRASASQGVNNKDKDDRMDIEVEDLPSASVRFRHGGLFDGVLRESGGVEGQD